MSSFYVGLDLGQAQDYTALSVLGAVEVPVGEPTEALVPQNPLVSFRGHAQPMAHATVQEAERHYHLRHLERYPLGTPYPEIARGVVSRLALPVLRGAALVVDATGVGRPVVDMLREEGLKPIPVLITGGNSVSHEDGFYRVPKRDLVASLQVLLQNERLKFAAELPLLETLKSELHAFKAKINIATGHDTYEAWRERDHDDLVLSVALPLWYAQWRYRTRGAIRTQTTVHSGLRY